MQSFADAVAMVPWFQAVWPREGVVTPLPPEMVIHVASFLARTDMSTKDIARIRGFAVAPYVPPVRRTPELALAEEERIRRSLIWDYIEQCHIEALKEERKAPVPGYESDEEEDSDESEESDETETDYSDDLEEFLFY